MKQKPAQIKLDRSKLLGFKLEPLTPSEKTDGKTSSKLGAKFGAKIGAKPGIRAAGKL
jgi:hypothetical protein